MLLEQNGRTDQAFVFADKVAFLQNAILTESHVADEIQGVTPDGRLDPSSADVGEYESEDEDV